MHKFSFVLIFLLLLAVSACADQATPVANTAAPTSEPVLADIPTKTPTLEVPPTEIPTGTPPPSISLVDQYPQIVSSSDLFNRVLSTTPGDPQRIAYCAPGEIRVSQDAGQTWDSISTQGVVAAALERSYELFYGEPAGADVCASVTLDPDFPGTYYAVFTTAHEDYGAPPVFYMGFFTTDGGESWQFVDPPENATIEDFGGFWNLGTDGVQALFFSAGSWSEIPDEFLIIETADGGLEWSNGVLSCPAAGPCLRWGPAPSNIPGMGSPLPQSILYSPDDGGTWSVIEPPAELRAPSPNQLVMLSDAQVLIISGSINLSAEAAVIRSSMDAGASWQPVPIPPLSTEEINENYFPGLQYLANQSYITQAPEDSTWYWLQPDLPIWCPVNTQLLPSFPVVLQSVGDQVWWIDPDTQQAEYLSLSDLTCAVE
jgi:photosystem II stability/assembly factor-like uncharacterized protein